MCKSQAQEEACECSSTYAVRHVSEGRCRREGQCATCRIRARHGASGQESLHIQRKPVGDCNNQAARKKHKGRPTK